MHIVGARPQFIKASVVFQKMKEFGVSQSMVHTGQHYDYNMSDIFFKELQMDAPDVYLGVGSGSHGEQTGKMLNEIEKMLLKLQPSMVIVYGDINTTLAGALAASKLKISLAHVEAGLRSFDKNMPEELNRVITDHVSDILFAPTKGAVENLKKESIINNVFNVGDVMYDVALTMGERVEKHEESILEKYRLKSEEYVLVTVHRESNTNSKVNLFGIMDALIEAADSGKKVFFPMHPRTKKYLTKYGFDFNDVSDNLVLNDPVSYNEMIVFEKNARLIVTDSGGVQKEAYFFKTPAVIPRDETEWIEITEAGWNILTGADKERTVNAIDFLWGKTDMKPWESFYGDGNAARHICETVTNHITEMEEDRSA
jgi:UDP-N-acetylglucosamine 2-epimerase